VKPWRNTGEVRPGPSTNCSNEVVHFPAVSQHVREPSNCFGGIVLIRGSVSKRRMTGTDIYSTRVGLGYRALGQMEGEQIVWSWIGLHAEYGKLLRG